MIADVKTLARLLGLPYFPVTPFFPLLGPRRCAAAALEVATSSSASRCRPTGSGAAAADDPMLVFNITDQVRETIQQSLYRLLSQRRSAFRA